MVDFPLMKLRNGSSPFLNCSREYPELIGCDYEPFIANSLRELESNTTIFIPDDRYT